VGLSYGRLQASEQASASKRAQVSDRLTEKDRDGERPIQYSRLIPQGPRDPLDLRLVPIRVQLCDFHPASFLPRPTIHMPVAPVSE
jgi:hypothetical protein